MTDYPRFEQVKGDQDRAHEAYHGGPLVTAVLKIVDAWIGQSPKSHNAQLPAREAEIEIHERPAVLALVRAAVQPASADPAPLVRRSAPDESFSDSFLLGSARTMKAQAVLLATIAALLVLLVSQGLTLPERPRDQTARNGGSPSDATIKKVRNGNGTIDNVIFVADPNSFDR